MHFLDHQSLVITTFTNHQKLLAIALEEARSGLAQGGIPVGMALFSADGILPGRRHNRRIQECDPSSHGEKDAFRKAGRLKACRDKILITTLAPCRGDPLKAGHF